MATERRLRFKTRREYRQWLGKNCLINESVWIVFYKDGTRGITYHDALEESLCFGWIDSIVKKIDEKIYVRKFSRRRSRSIWSEVNKKKAGELIDRGLMTSYGLKAIEDAKRNSLWEKEDERAALIDVDGFRDVLKKKLRRMSEYDHLSDSLKKYYSLVYFAAKKEETRKRRLELIMEYMKTKKRFM